ncbi:PPC domain-containing protein [Hirschfeldia incana]|nr:PPC domain-containing protein [Hirschfeldia incana]
MEGGREAMQPPFPPPFYFPRGPFSSQSASAVHAPPGFRPMSNPNLQHQHHPFPLGEQRHHQDFSHVIHMGMAAASSSSPSPTMQQQQPVPPTPPPPHHHSVASAAAEEEPMVKKKRGRPRKYVPDNNEGCDLELSPMQSLQKPKISSPVSDPNAPKRARGRPPGTGRKQRLANLGEWMNTSAGFAFATHVISVEAGEDIVSKVLSFSQQRPRALCIMSGTGMASAFTLRQTGSSAPTLSFQGHFDILSLQGCYLVNEEGGSKSRTGGISVSLSRHDGFLIGGTVGTLIAASLVQVVACSFVYGSAKGKVIKQENGSKEDNNTTKKDNSLETPASEQPSPPRATESAAEGAQTPLDYSSPGWAGSGGGSRTTDSRNNNHLTDIDLTRG